jgi:hypothetical protein
MDPSTPFANRRPFGTIIGLRERALAASGEKGENDVKHRSTTPFIGRK